MNRFILFMLSFIALYTFENKAMAQKQKPNILWIITDEHNFRTLGCYRELLAKDQAHIWGDTDVKTPNIDWLAHNGAVFTKMYSSSPVCSPCRASMFTGQYPQTVNVPRNDMVMDKSYPTIASVLSKEGYTTGYCGKWHLSGNDRPGWEPKPNYGFQDNRYMFNRGHWKKLGFDSDDQPCVAALDQKGEPSYNVANADEKSFTTDWLADRTIDFIDANKHKPFYYVVSIPDPHGPNSVRAPYDNMYANAKFDIPKTYYAKKQKDDPKWSKQDPGIDNVETLKEIYLQYYGMVKCIDDNIGRIINKLKEDGILDNTIILFASDHGDLMGEHHRLNKGVPYEGSAKIPFIVYSKKGIKAGTVVDKAANATDWMETFLSMADVKEHPKTAGRDLTPLIKNPALKNWDDITFSRMGSWVAAFDSRYKLIVDNSKSDIWLMDEQKDPDELTNFIANPEYKQIAVQLAKRLNTYLAVHNDPLKDDSEIQGKINKLIGISK